MEILYNCLWVGLGGSFGAICRYLIGLTSWREETIFPINTLIVNVLGSFIIGILAGWSQKNHQNLANWLLLLQVGFCGSFTTLSSVSLELWRLNDGRNFSLMLAYGTLTISLCLLATWLGLHCWGRDMKF